MKSWEKIKKRKKPILIVMVLLLILVPVLMFVLTPDTTTVVPAGLEVEESIDTSFSEWSFLTKVVYTAIVSKTDPTIGDYIQGIDTSTQNRFTGTLGFNSIDIGYAKIHLRADPNQVKYANYFGIYFNGMGQTLFKIERTSDVFTFVVLNGIAIQLFEFDLHWHTIEVFFDLRDGSNGEVSVSVDGIKIMDEFLFDQNNIYIDEIFFCSAIAPLTIIDVGFETIYNYKIV